MLYSSWRGLRTSAGRARAARGREGRPRGRERGRHTLERKRRCDGHRGRAGLEAAAPDRQERGNSAVESSELCVERLNARLERMQQLVRGRPGPQDHGAEWGQRGVSTGTERGAEGRDGSVPARPFHEGSEVLDQLRGRVKVLGQGPVQALHVVVRSRSKVRAPRGALHVRQRLDPTHTHTPEYTPNTSQPRAAQHRRGRDRQRTRAHCCWRTSSANVSGAGICAMAIRKLTSSAAASWSALS